MGWAYVFEASSAELTRLTGIDAGGLEVAVRIDDPNDVPEVTLRSIIDGRPARTWSLPLDLVRRER